MHILLHFEQWIELTLKRPQMEGAFSKQFQFYKIELNSDYFSRSKVEKYFLIRYVYFHWTLVDKYRHTP